VTAQPSGVLALVGQALALKKIVEDKIAKGDFFFVSSHSNVRLNNYYVLHQMQDALS